MVYKMFRKDAKQRQLNTPKHTMDYQKSGEE